MTIEEFDSRIRSGDKSGPWILDPATGFSYMWTGYKRKYDSRLMTSNDPTISLDPIDDSLVGQWIGRQATSIFYYASVPGGSGLSRQGELIDCDVKYGQSALTINSSPDLLEHCRKEGFARLIVIMEKMGAIDGPNFRMA